MSELEKERIKDEKKRWRWELVIALVIALVPVLVPIIYKNYGESKEEVPLIEEPKVETVAVTEIKSEKSFDIILKGLEDYRDKYVNAYNKNNMSYIKEFYISDRSDFYNETERFIAKSHNDNRKIDDLEIILKNDERKGSNTYDVAVDLVFTYDVNGNKEKETVTNRHFIIDITEDSKIILISSPLDARGDSIVNPL